MRLNTPRLSTVPRKIRVRGLGWVHVDTGEHRSIALTETFAKPTKSADLDKASRNRASAEARPYLGGGAVAARIERLEEVSELSPTIARSRNQKTRKYNGSRPNLGQLLASLTRLMCPAMTPQQPENARLPIKAKPALWSINHGPIGTLMAVACLTPRS